MPGWLAEVVRQRRTPVPWFDMLRAVVAICVPLSVALAAGKGTLGVLPGIGWPTTATCLVLTDRWNR